MLKTEDFGPVQALRQGRQILGLPPYMTVCCYAVDGLLIDSGLPGFATGTLAWARQQQVRQAALTHHHEDHSGGAAQMQRAGIPVQASPDTAALVQRGFAVRFYEWVVWGKAQRARLETLPGSIATERHQFQVLPAPGHCADQVVLYEPKQGWLFSGDAFLARKIKYFRADEDFAATVASLERLSQLDFADLFCAHRPVLQRGPEALLQKLQYLRDLEGRVRELHGQGLSPRRITQRLLGKEPLLLFWFSAGDLAKINLVRSILEGPRRRADAL